MLFNMKLTNISTIQNNPLYLWLYTSIYISGVYTVAKKGHPRPPTATIINRSQKLCSRWRDRLCLWLCADLPEKLLAVICLTAQALV